MPRTPPSGFCNAVIRPNLTAATMSEGICPPGKRVGEHGDCHHIRLTVKERPQMFCAHARRAWSCPMSGIAKTLHELFSIQHHRLFWHMGPDPFWQTAPWLARALQLIRQRFVGFLCPGCHLCTFQSLSRCGQFPIQHTPQSPVCAAWNICLLPPSLPAPSAVFPLPELLLLRPISLHWPFCNFASNNRGSGILPPLGGWISSHWLCG